MSGPSGLAATETTARRLHQLVEPIHLVTYFAEEPTDALMALGHRNYWDGYFAGRAAPLGAVPAEVVHAIFYNFAPGEVARHIPRVWETASPDAALTARRQGSAAALTRILGGLVDSTGLARAADLATAAASSAPTLAAVVDGMRARGLIETSGWLSDAGRQTKERIEARSDELAAAPYDSLSRAELDQLVAELEPITAALDAAGSR